MLFYFILYPGIQNGLKIISKLIYLAEALIKGQLISKCPFGVFKSIQKTNIFFRISALASKKRSNQKSSVRHLK